MVSVMVRVYVFNNEMCCGLNYQKIIFRSVHMTICVFFVVTGECSGEGCTESHSSSQNHKSGVGLQLTLEQMLEVCNEIHQCLCFH